MMHAVDAVAALEDRDGMPEWGRKSAAEDAFSDST